MEKGPPSYDQAHAPAPAAYPHPVQQAPTSFQNRKIRTRNGQSSKWSFLHFFPRNYRDRYERPGRSGSDDPDVPVVSSHHRDQVGVRNNHQDPHLRSDSVSVHLLALCLHTVLFDVVPRREPLLPQLWLLHWNLPQVETAFESSFYHS
uniref:(northern house mosquito) hypothetical protein n=1 Tax=Culex pipiens TaxID=7175 RepID=A0A8D8DWX7_CULPI